MMRCPSGWSEQVFGEENFWIKETGMIQILLGLGPALGPGASLMRLRQLSEKADFPFGTLVCAQQVHGSSIAVLGEETVESAGTYDGLISATPGRGVVVWTADCVPILISGVGAVAAVHAGWRGIAAGILPRAINQFLRLYGLAPSKLSATIGPAVGACHYPVGPEVITALDRIVLSNGSWRQGNRVDLRLYLRSQLLDLGLQETATEIVGPCTSCDPRFASFRRDGLSAGRQISIIGLTTG